MKENSGLAIAVAVGTIMFVAMLPVLIVVLVYVFGTVYAIVKGAGAGGRSPNAATVVIGIVMIVSTLVALLYGGIAAMGRLMDPKKRADRNAA